MKKTLITLLGLTLLTTGCNNTNDNNDKLSIVTTTYPTYDWLKEITSSSENVEITILGDNGIDLHSYQATSEDLIKVSEADMFIYIGGPSDNWVDDALKNKTNEDMIVVNLADELGDKVLQEETVEGMQEEHDHEEESHDEHDYIDEHIWLSLNNAITLVDTLNDEVINLDKENEKVYQENTDNYIKSLTTLENKYQETVDKSTTKTLLVADRFPFRYLTNDYNLNYYAAFSGCSADTEASFETIAFLSDKLISEDINYVIDTTGRTHKLPETVISTSNKSNIEILTLNSMQSISEKDLDETSYIKIMEENLKVLEIALGVK